LPFVSLQTWFLRRLDSVYLPVIHPGMQLYTEDLKLTGYVASCPVDQTSTQAQGQEYDNISTKVWHAVTYVKRATLSGGPYSSWYGVCGEAILPAGSLIRPSR